MAHPVVLDDSLETMIRQGVRIREPRDPRAIEASALRDLVAEVRRGNEQVLEVARQALADARAVTERQQPESIGPLILAAISDLAEALRNMPAPQVTVQANMPPAVVNVQQKPVDVHVTLTPAETTQEFRIEKDAQGRMAGITKVTRPADGAKPRGDHNDR